MKIDASIAGVATRRSLQDCPMWYSAGHKAGAQILMTASTNSRNGVPTAAFPLTMTFRIYDGLPG